MMQRRLLIRGVALLVVLMLLVAACGGASIDDGTDDSGPADLPPADSPSQTPNAAGACLEGEPDCNDTPGDIGPPLPLDDAEPGSDGGAVTSDGTAVDGGLEVSEALDGDVTGVISVQGYLVDDGTVARFCEALAESYPPQCGGASIPITNYEEIVDVPLEHAQGVTWTNERFTAFGEIVDGTFVVDPTIVG